MIAATLTAYFIVPLFGVLMCTAPAVTRRTVQFGVRVPPGHVDAAVIRRERRAYQWRTAVVAVSCTAIAIIVRADGSRWLPRVVLLVEAAADLGCYWLARKRIATVKTAENWFAGLQQTVATDTSWRTQPQRFPIRWLTPAIAVIAATVIIGIARYPGLPSRLATGLVTPTTHRVPKSPVSAFSVVIAQVYVTGMWTGLLMLVYRSRPDIDSADPAASLRSYRRLLTAFARAALTLLALLDVSLLLVGLQQWRVYRLAGAAAALPLLPFVAGVLILVIAAVWAGRARLHSGDQRPGPAAGSDRDDDRLWKAGLFYVNRNDPAIVVPARFGVSWTLNLGNRAAWLIIAGIIAVPAGLEVIGIAAGR
jgi:uncharacterized membrane protein